MQWVKGTRNYEHELFAHQGKIFWSASDTGALSAFVCRKLSRPFTRISLVCVIQNISGPKVRFLIGLDRVSNSLLADVVEFWSHHEKVVVVDNHRACIGGLDICFGRWDTHNHPLADAHPTDFSRTLFPGQDYNNARIVDFQNVSDYVSETISVLESPRMPWHDVRFSIAAVLGSDRPRFQTHMTIDGPVVLDIVQHFAERWNLVKLQKVCPHRLLITIRTNLAPSCS